MGVATIQRKARKRAREVRARTGRLGGAIRGRAGDLGMAVRSTAGEAGGAVRARAGELGQRAAEQTRGTRRRVGYWIAGEEPRRRRIGGVVVAAVAGAAAAFFLDPVSGKRRRHVAGDWIAARFRRGVEKVRGTGRMTGAEARGAWRAVTHVPEAGTPENDATLAHKVESEIFPGLDLPSGRVNVNSEFGVITLRGTVDRPDQIEEIEGRTRRVSGVRDVRNLLHLSGTAAPIG